MARSDSAHGQAIADELRRGHDIFERMKNRKPSSRDLDDIINKSTFQLVKTKQFVHGFESTGWVPAAPILSMAIEKLEATTSSLVSEEQVHFMKNGKRARASKRHRQPQRCMAVAIAQKVCLDVQDIHNLHELFCM